MNFLKITEKAYAKLNLSLDILSKRADGYHNIRSVFSTVSLYDTVTAEISDTIKVVCSDGTIPEKDNICTAAAKGFFEMSGIKGGCVITVQKNIPTAAGLGGGSADAAAVLRALNRLYDGALREENIKELALSLGADVPFLLSGGVALVEGIGEKIAPLKPLPDCDIIIVKEGEKPSTGRLYSKYDNLEKPFHPDVLSMVTAVEVGDIKKIASLCGNGFSALWGDDTENIKQEMLLLGALTAELSGSGPSVFGIFEKGAGNTAFTKLKEKYSATFLVKPV